MTDPAGRYGSRSGRAIGSTIRLGRVADRAEPISVRPLGLLLLPAALERFALRAHVEDLLSGPGVLAVDPPRLGASARTPASVADGLSVGQARRLRLPGAPRAILIFHPLQYPLARALIVRYPEAELWYWRRDVAAPTGSRLRRDRHDELHLAATLRAALLVLGADEELTDAHDPRAELVLLAPSEDPHEDNRPLWRRLEMLGIESGRLGSERL
jgi:hypothetical protein